MDRICVVCGSVKPENLKVLGFGICADCEHTMLNVDPQDTQYDAFVSRLSMALSSEG